MTTARQLAERAAGLSDLFRRNHRGFLGVFSSDDLPSPRKIATGLATAPVVTLIANTSPEGDKGAHWIAMSFDTKGSACFFDSYGSTSDRQLGRLLAIGTANHYQTHFNDYALGLGFGRIYSNAVDLQDLTTDTCGEWSLWFCLNGDSTDNPRAWKSILKRPTALGRDRAVVAAVGIRSPRDLDRPRPIGVWD